MTKRQIVEQLKKTTDEYFALSKRVVELATERDQWRALCGISGSPQKQRLAE